MAGKHLTRGSDRYVRKVWGSSHILMLEQHLQRRNDLTPLTDPTWIAGILSKLPAEAAQKTGAGTGWRGLSTKVEVLDLKPASR